MQMDDVANPLQPRLHRHAHARRDRREGPAGRQRPADGDSTGSSPWVIPGDLEARSPPVRTASAGRNGCLSGVSCVSHCLSDVSQLPEGQRGRPTSAADARM
jgi:hypothetical protein